MTYEDVKNLKDGDFKRLCGVTKETFAAMCEVVFEAKQLNRRGRKSNLSIENQVLLTVSFWRVLYLQDGKQTFGFIFRQQENR